MKTKNMLMKTIALTLFGLAAVNCGSNNGSNTTPVPYTGIGTTGYTLQANGQCISTTTGQIAPSPTYCTTSQYGNTGYPGTPGYGGGSICQGMYSWNGQTGMCYGQPDNCRGYTLTSLQTGQQVYCQ